MPTFKSGRYPQMQVNTEAGAVRFRDGRAEVTDEQAEVLRSMPEEFQLTEVPGEAKAAEPETPAKPKRPTKTASKE